jgi:hypothetical protein
MSDAEEPALVWYTPQDGLIITKRMYDDEVGLLCHGFGASRLAQAIEDWLERRVKQC